MSDGGKGSAPRPLSVTQEQYDNRWDYIFSRDKPKPADSDDPNLDGVNGSMTVSKTAGGGSNPSRDAK